MTKCLYPNIIKSKLSEIKLFAFLFGTRENRKRSTKNYIQEVIQDLSSGKCYGQ